MESDSESDDAGHGNQDQPAVDDREDDEEEDDPATLDSIQQQLQTLVQATTSMVGAINQLATIQQAGQAAGAAGAAGNVGAANANVAAAPTNPTFHRSLLAAVMEQSGYLDYSSNSFNTKLAHHTN